jgi:hypothetical protein
VSSRPDRKARRKQQLADRKKRVALHPPVYDSTHEVFWPAGASEPGYPGMDAYQVKMTKYLEAGGLVTPVQYTDFCFGMGGAPDEVTEEDCQRLDVLIRLARPLTDEEKAWADDLAARAGCQISQLSWDAPDCPPYEDLYGT